MTTGEQNNWLMKVNDMQKQLLAIFVPLNYRLEFDYQINYIKSKLVFIICLKPISTLEIGFFLYIIKF
jgi:hypothetical protein